MCLTIRSIDKGWIAKLENQCNTLPHIGLCLKQNRTFGILIGLETINHEDIAHALAGRNKIMNQTKNKMSYAIVSNGWHWIILHHRDDGGLEFDEVIFRPAPEIPDVEMARDLTGKIQSISV